MNTNTLIIIGVIGVVAVGGFLYWKSEQDKKAKIVVPSNQQQRDTATNNLAETIKAGAGALATLEDVYRNYGGY